jgi:hypothetical protein
VQPDLSDIQVEVQDDYVVYEPIESEAEPLEADDHTAETHDAFISATVLLPKCDSLNPARVIGW